MTTAIACHNCKRPVVVSQLVTTGWILTSAYVIILSIKQSTIADHKNRLGKMREGDMELAFRRAHETTTSAMRNVLLRKRVL